MTEATGPLYPSGHDNGILYRLAGPDLEAQPRKDLIEPPDPPDPVGRLSREAGPAGGILSLAPEEAGVKRLPAVFLD